MLVVSIMYGIMHFLVMKKIQEYHANADYNHTLIQGTWAASVLWTRMLRILWIL